jgi:integrase
MTSTNTKRRGHGEGSVSSYATASGLRWRYRAPVTLADGSRKRLHVRGFTSKKAAQSAMIEALAASNKGTYTDPSKQPLGTYLAQWLDGLRLAPSTVASYRKNVRLHIAPYLGSTPLASLTPAQLNKLYRDLEKSGRTDHRSGEGLSARTVRYVHTILSSALHEAVKTGLLARNPAAMAKPPSAKEAASPEMTPWTAAQLSAFLAWSEEHSPLHAAWWVLAYTGMRRGELLALRWRDVDLDAGIITIRRSATLVRNAGVSVAVTEGPTKSGKARVVDIDPATVAALKAWKSARGTLHLALAMPDALVIADVNGHGHRHPERFSRTFSETVQRAIRDGVEIPAIRLHDLRHTHATLLLTAGTPVKVVSERLGHSSAVVTMTVYAHCLPGDQRKAAEGFAAMLAAEATS